MIMKNSIFVKLIFTLILSTNIFATDVDILTSYRIKGVYEIQRQLDQKLASKDYWNTFLQNVDTTFGYMESYCNVLTCNKSKSSMKIYIKDKKVPNSNFKKSIMLLQVKEKVIKSKKVI